LWKIFGYFADRDLNGLNSHESMSVLFSIAGDAPSAHPPRIEQDLEPLGQNDCFVREGKFNQLPPQVYSLARLTHSFRLCYGGPN